ncbi:MAG: S9 family peptidase [Bacteroides sp.]|nr:S9 family peptidase [Bacteroides sp.]
MRIHLISLTAAGALSLAAVAASAATVPLTPLRAGKPLHLPVPAKPDSVSSENPLDLAQMLDRMPALTRFNLRRQAQDYTTVLPDSAGHYSLGAPAGGTGLTMQRMYSSVRPASFFKGKLKVSAPGRFKAFVNGAEVLSKTTQDSVASPAEGALTLQPMQDALVEIRLLSDGAPGSIDVELIPDEGYEETVIIQGPDTKQYFNLHTMGEGPRIAQATLSPDGKYILIRATDSFDSLSTSTTMSVVETASNRTVIENIGTGYEWLPSRPATLIHNRSRKDGTFDIETLEPATQKRGVLAEGIPEEAADYVMSPNEDYIVYYTQKEGTPESGIMRRVTSPDDRQPGNRDRAYLSMVRLKGELKGMPVPLTYGGGSTYMTDISPKGDKILYTSSRETPEEFPFYQNHLIQLDVNTLKTDTIRGTDASMVGAVYSPDAKQLFIMAGPNAFGGIGLNAGKFDWGNDFDIQGYIMDIASGKVRAVTRDFNPSIKNNAKWNPGDNRIYFLGEDGFDLHLYTLDPATDRITRVPAEVDFIRDYSVASRKGDYVAYTGMSYTYMGRAYVRDMRSGKTSLIADPMADLLKSYDFGEYDYWNFTAPDGTLVEGTVTLPPDFSPEKKYPAIVYYYGGTAPSNHVNYHPYTPQLLASRGYVVYVLNPSGTTGYGQEFSARHVNAWGDYTADEIIYGVKEFCRTHPYVDADKIGCMGASYGGFMTQLLQTKTDIFAAAVSHAGISNITSYWGEGFWGYSYNSVAAARSYPWNNPKLFTENSPLFHADRIHTPLLLLHGTVDTNVPIGESIQLYNALRLLNRPVEFITVQGSDHVVVDFEQRKEWHATIMAWFEKWLKGDSRWWDSIYKK